MRLTEILSESLNTLHDPKQYQQVLSAWEEYYGPGEGQQLLDQYSQTIDALNQQGGTVYRAVWIVPGEKPRLDEPGKHWTTSFEQAEKYLESTAGHAAWADLSGEGEPVPYIISATVGPNNITNRNVILSGFPDEFEVGLVNPASAKISIVKQVDNPFDKYMNTINEERGGYLYHGMNPAKATAVFANDSMPANYQSNIPGVGRINGNSFSRNKLYGTEYSYGGYLVQLTIDQASLAQTHKMIPVNAERVHSLAVTNNTRRNLGNPEHDITDMPRGSNDRAKTDPRGRMDEEFVVGNINNLHKYVVSIAMINSSASMAIPPAAAWSLTNYCKKYKIPLTGPERILNAVKKSAARAKAQIKKGGTVADYYTNIKHPDPAEIAAKWEKWHNNPMDPKAAEEMRQYYAQPEVAARNKAWAEKVAAMKAAGTYE